MNARNKNMLLNIPHLGRAWEGLLFTMNTNEVYAAIALALHEHLGNNVHDIEPGIITIAEHHTQWNGYAQSMTQRP